MAIIRTVFLVCAATAAVVLTACGGSSSPSPSSAPSTTQSPTNTQSAVASEGKAVFVSNCAQCHTLAAAAANGKIGPNLDQLQPDAARVKTQVTNGGDGMPAFGDVLTAAQIDAVSAYVAESAGE